LNRLILVLAATLYLLLGISLIAAGTATFFTVFGKIFTWVYAVSFIGLGVAILLISIAGYIAACRKSKKCWLGIFMIFDLIVMVLFIVAVVYMFRYEDVLKVASKANMETEIESGVAGLDAVSTDVIEQLVTRTFDTCQANTTMVASPPPVYNFTCENRNNIMQELSKVVSNCVIEPVNATEGTSMYNCYHSTLWNETTTLYQPWTTASLLPVLNTPKGIFCACSSAIINEVFLPYINIFKWVGIGVSIFLLLIFLSCCFLCCCVPKPKDDDNKMVEFTPRNQPQGWSAGSNIGASQKGRGHQGYIARP